jgi:exosortase/archaeosortase family protein
VLLLANVLRVLAITLIAQVLHRPELAHIVHEPLGLVGFAAACAIAGALLPADGTVISTQIGPPPCSSYATP